jgi:hypothetical protein
MGMSWDHGLSFFDLTVSDVLVYDSNMNPVGDYSLQFLATPEPSALQLLAMIVGVVAVNRARVRYRTIR